MAPNGKHFFTSESVTEGHPDKISDQISDAVLDSVIESDPTGRVACETLVTTGMVVVAGEITTSAWVDIPEDWECPDCGVNKASFQMVPDTAQAAGLR